MLTHKGYHGHVEYDDEAEIFHGEVLDLRDVVTFQGRSVDEIRQAFTESVDDYLAFCAERGEEPDRPFSGRFMLRLPPEVHRRLYLEARRQDKSLNEVIVGYLESAKGE